MQCYKCDNHLTEGNHCEFCGADVTYYKKIVYSSNALYNVALEKAQTRDLSGAIYFLHQSLKMNKKNINARNLLGLVYYEVGEVSEALSHWVISKNFQQEDNIAVKYLNAIQNNQSRLETVNQTIKKFNKALEYTKQGNYDLAVIQLKKVLTITPNYVKGNQLLALLHMRAGEYDKARRAIVGALKVDNTNTKSIRFLTEIREQLAASEANISPREKKEKRALEEQKKPLSGNDVIIPNYSFKEYSKPTMTIINIIIGVIIGAAIILFLVTPAKTASVRSEYKQVVLEYETKITALETTISQLSENDNQTADAKAAYEATINDYDYLIAAYNKYTAKAYVESADYLYGISTLEGKSENFVALYNAFVADCLAQATNQANQTAWNAYNSGDYDNAIAYFERCAKYDATNPDHLYNLGMSYTAKGDTANANAIYQRVVESFPGTPQAGRAQADIQ